MTIGIGGSSAAEELAALTDMTTGVAAITLAEFRSRIAGACTLMADNGLDAVFLGLHLLITDPSTSPRTVAGKTIFGALYGVGVFALYALLGATGSPTRPPRE